MYKYKLVYALAVLASLTMYIATNQRQILILLLFLVVILLASGGMLLLSHHYFQLDFQLQDACVVYRRCPVLLSVRSNTVLPTGCVVLQLDYENILYQSVRSQEIILVPSASRPAQYELPFVSDDCGKIRIIVKKAVCYDLLGIFGRRITAAKNLEVTVYPELTPLQIQETSFPESKNMGDAYDAGKRGQDVTEVFDVRDYQEGDSIRSIHWKLSGKLDRMVIREFGNPSNYNTMVFCSLSVPEGTGQENRHMLQNGILGMMASVSRALMQQNHPHHVLDLDQSDLYEFAVDSEEAYDRMLAGVMSSKAGTMAADAVLRLLDLDLDQRYSKFILITGQIHEEAIRKLAERISLTVILISPEERGHVEKGRNYEIIMVPAGHDHQNLHTLEI